MRDFGWTMLSKLQEKAVWPLIAAFALIFTFLLGFYWRLSLVAVLCTGAKDEHCAREWISATSTLVAAIVASFATIAAFRNLKEITRVQKENAYIYLIGQIALAKNVRRQTEYPPHNKLELIMRVNEGARRTSPMGLMQDLREGSEEMMAHLKDVHIQKFMDTFGPFREAEPTITSLGQLKRRIEYFEDDFGREKIPADRLTDRIIGVEITANLAWSGYARLLEEMAAAANALIERFDLRPTD
ncbi:hypothetical protein [Rhizobium laguerreae]|uniref:hypothetical protein n=1 Tax=Rhizobium laguerreae TaxID=1076926 RepID=UPI0030083E6C